MLTFNVEPSRISTYPIQICSTPYLNDLSYKGDAHKDSIWHVYYTTRIFNDMSSDKFSRSYAVLRAHINNAKRMGFGHVLIHGPSTYAEFMYALEPLRLLSNYYKDMILIEIPCFSKDVYNQIRGNSSPLDFMIRYISDILSVGFTIDNICIDTAHLWSDGLNIDDMIKLYKKYPTKYVHLNGNIAVQYKSDIHTFWWNPDNLITRDNNGDNLIKLFVDNGAICVLECTSPTTLWNSIARIKSFAIKHGFILAYQD